MLSGGVSNIRQKVSTTHITPAARMALIARPALVDATKEQIGGIDAALAAMTCEVDSASIAVEADGSFDLDDVQGADGQ